MRGIMYRLVKHGGTPSDRAKYQYFLKGQESMQADHFPDGEFTQGGNVYEFPNLSSSDYTI